MASARDDPDSRLPFGMSDETLIRLSYILSAIFFLIAILGAIGEIRGWWGLIGELAITVGTIGGLLAALGALYYGAGRGQVERIRDVVQDSNQKLDKLGQLDAIEDAIAGDEGMIRELDRIELQLDAQTGALGEQTQLLGQIRDRL